MDVGAGEGSREVAAFGKALHTTGTPEAAVRQCCSSQQPLSSGRVPFYPDIRAKVGWNPLHMDMILVQIVKMDCVREALGGC